ncbi:hypothetical protein [Sphingobium sp. EP60837]|uniref:hypothetical protein n=1 Tax=Sphingobium sp. EP60837 TaxID=1855519 RepID=UPI0007DD616C|nr:hypothetical protein [Sphingobium sp. EP60837]ANI78999.1 hypothetical protein EP837_02604 [Sphingobium sp. EP60837]
MNNAGAHKLDGYQEAGKHALDALSVVTVLGTLANILPSVAAGLSIIWTAIRIMETKTVRGWLSKGDADAEG